MRMNDATNVNISDSSSTFTALGIAPKILDALAKAQFSTPTPIQKQAIPAAIQGKDLIGIAQTGTGKTLAFGIPMIQRLAQVKGKGLVVLPTRELALQVEEALQLIGRTLGLRIAVLIGGASIGAQIKAIKKNTKRELPKQKNIILIKKHYNLRIRASSFLTRRIEC